MANNTYARGLIWFENWGFLFGCRKWIHRQLRLIDIRVIEERSTAETYNLKMTQSSFCEFLYSFPLHYIVYRTHMSVLERR
jgi:hypothetical protein